MIILGETKDFVEAGLIAPLKDRAKYVLALDEWGEVVGDRSYKDSPVTNSY
jgi:hypothetical protein